LHFFEKDVKNNLLKSRAKMNLYFILYVLISIIVISGSFYFNRSGGRNIASIITPVLYLVVAVFFGMRWFTTSGDAKVNTNLSPVWPPPNSLNVCPDFLSLRSDTSGATTKYYCIDTLGVSTNPNGIQKWSTSPSEAMKFSLGSVTAGSTTGQMTTSKKANWEDVQTLCNNCFTMGLSWEGVCIPGSGNVQLASGTSLPLPV